VEIRAADRRSDSSLSHYLQKLAKVYEAQEKYAAAEESYRRALKISEELDQPKDFLIVRALNALAGFYPERGRYPEAEDLSRRGLAIVEEKSEGQIQIDCCDGPRRKILRPGSNVLAFPSARRSIVLPRSTNVKTSMLSLSHSGDDR
jgi:tetratricopeptide (TPR) repeat protein